MKVTVFNFNGILDSLVSYLSFHGQLESNWQAADVVVLWQDVLGQLVNVAKQAKALGKRVYTVEHGLLSINDYIKPLSRPLIADKFLAWGQKSKEYMIEAGIEPDRIVITGTTVFDDFGPKRLHEGKNVLFAPRHWTPDLEENLKIANRLRGMKGVNIKSKIIEGEHDPDKYPNPFSTDRQRDNHLKECYRVLSDTDVLVTLGEGTFAALAYYLDIPVISTDEWEQKELLGKIYTKDIFFEQVSYACNVIPIEKLNQTIKQELRHPEARRLKRLNFLKEYCNYDGGSALENILKVIYG